MKSLRTISLCVSLAVAAAAFAEQPADPGAPGQGGPPSASAPLPKLLDSTGKVVGDILQGGLTGATVKYVLPDGDHVLLSASGSRLTPHGGSVDEFDGDPFEDAYRISALFPTADCSGDAWIPAHKAPAALTRRQAIGIPGLHGFDLRASCPDSWIGGNLMFVSAPLACPVVADAANPVTFLAYYGYEESTDTFGCIPIPGDGLTAPDEFDSSPWRLYSPAVDLDAEFTPPFYVP